MGSLQKAAETFCDTASVPPGEGVIHVVPCPPDDNDLGMACGGDAAGTVVICIENNFNQMCFLQVGLRTRLGDAFGVYLGLKGESDDLAFSFYSGSLLLDVTTDMTAMDLELPPFHTFVCKMDNMFDEILREQLRGSALPDQ